MKAKENVPLIVGLAIPLAMIVFVGMSIYLPGLFVKPNYDFLYASGGDYYTQKMFDVENQRIVKSEPNYPSAQSTAGDRNNYSPPLKKKAPRLFIHDIRNNQSREISFEEAQKLIISDNIKSPDGFEIVSGGYGGGLFYSHSNYGKKYLKGHNLSKELEIQSSSNRYGDYYYQFNFVGWILGKE